MPTAVLYDIHGNLPALEAVLREVIEAGADRLVVGGDVVPGPMASESLTCLLRLDLPLDFIHGNGESAVLASRAGRTPGHLPEPVQRAIRWVGEHLDPEHARLMTAWPGTLRRHIDGVGDVLFCHATPHNDTDIFTRMTPAARLLPLFDPLGVALVVCGHTHMQFDRQVGETRVVNAGSVGMPFGVTGADWLLLGPAVMPRHTTYDLANAAERIRATDYPDAAAFAANYVLQTPSEEEMLSRYSSVGL